MKAPKLYAAIRIVSCWIAAFLPGNLWAATYFPIATNGAIVEFAGPVFYDGTNYLTGIISGTNVSVQRFSSNGGLLGSLLNVGANAGFPPAVALAAGQTNYLVAWSDYSLSSGVTMFGQFVTRGGAKFGSAFHLLQSQGSHGFQAVKGLASDGTNYLAVWQDKNDDHFYGQLITASGTLSGSEFLISGQQQNGDSAVVAFGKTNYLVGWQSSNDEEGDMNKTFGAIVSRSGTAGGWFQISQAISPSQNPLAVGFDGTNYLVVWNHDIGPGFPSPTDWDIHGRLVSQVGTLPGNELTLVNDAGSQVLPSLAFDGSSYLLAWGDSPFETTNSTIRFRFFDRSASPVGPDFTLFANQGTNAPLFTLNSVAFDGARLVAAAMLGTIQTDLDGSVTNIPSGDVYGVFISSSTAPAQLDVTGPLTGAQFPLLLTGTPGINYIIQTKTNLASINWGSLVTNSPTNGAFTFSDTHATNTSRFYRAVKQ